MKNQLLIAAAIILFRPLALICAEPMDYSVFSSELSEKMKSVDAVAFSFRQDIFAGDSTQTIKASVDFKKPDRVYIRYTAPQRQEVICNGEYLYTYIPEIKQATRQKREDVGNLLGITPSLIMSENSIGELKKDYNISFSRPAGAENTVLMELVPFDKRDFDRMVITFSRDTYMPLKTVISAPNVKSVTDFTDYTLNKAFSDDYFRLKPAEKINIIELN
ncbi:MAG: outer membrane lipoprotein carrier protein LolA [Elusimicrobia bacterium]|nr:outer membrane lipoprotein carrier protein LolA [Elusimicrobiota bacterium]